MSCLYFSLHVSALCKTQCHVEHVGFIYLVPNCSSSVISALLQSNGQWLYISKYLVMLGKKKSLFIRKRLLADSGSGTQQHHTVAGDPWCELCSCSTGLKSGDCKDNLNELSHVQETSLRWFELCDMIHYPKGSSHQKVAFKWCWLILRSPKYGKKITTYPPAWTTWDNAGWSNRL